MTSHKHPAYSPRMMNGWQHTGAFVIQFHTDTDVNAGRFEGRVEHVASGQAMRFYSLGDLLTFLDRALKEALSGSTGAVASAE